MGDGSPPWLNPQHDIYEDRGDPAASDFAVGDLTTDAAWHDLDLSAIVPVNAKAVILYVQIQAPAQGSIYFRKNGNVNAVNISRAFIQVANIPIAFDFVVPLDQNRVVEYTATNIAWNTVTIAIKGWFN